MSRAANVYHRFAMNLKITGDILTKMHGCTINFPRLLAALSPGEIYVASDLACLLNLSRLPELRRLGKNNTMKASCNEQVKFYFQRPPSETTKHRLQERTTDYFRPLLINLTTFLITRTQVFGVKNVETGY